MKNKKKATSLQPFNYQAPPNIVLSNQFNEELMKFSSLSNTNIKAKRVFVSKR